MLKKVLVMLLVVAGWSTSAQAGEQYIDATGYAVSGYDVVAYFDLQQSPVGETQPEGIPGRADLTTEYNGAKFAFSNQANLDRFLADPAGFAPQFDGHCAYGVAVGNKVPGNPNLWRIVDGKLYLNITKSVVKDWEEDIPGYILQANAEWANGLEMQSASDDRIPKFSSEAPLAN